MRSHRNRIALSIVAICVTGMALYVPGMRWGLPATSSWSQDTIAGVRTLGAVETWPGDWKGRYPPLHYLINRSVYEPILRHWTNSGDLTRDPKDGRLQFAPPVHEKIGTLILASRLVSVLFAIGAALGLWLCARNLTGCDRAALASALVFMSGAAFVYFAHLGNVDVPSMFWFCASTWFYARVLNNGRWMDVALLGLLGSLAMSTKDSIAGAYPGMAIVLLVTEFHRVRGDGPTGRAMIRALFRWRWIIGIAAFAIPYLLINGVVQNPSGYVERMKYWLDVIPDTIHARQYRYSDQPSLAIASMRYAAGAVGWPMLVMMFASTIYALIRYRRVALIVLTPALGYYLIVIARIDFVYSRFLFPMLAMASVLVGICLRDLLGATNRDGGVDVRKFEGQTSGAVPSSRFESSRRFAAHPFVKAVIVGGVVLPSVGYAVAINFEMRSDSRHAAEDWFRQNVASPSSVGATSKPQYMPRLAELGYATYAFEMERASFDQPQPEYLVLTSYDYEDYNANQQACMDDLIAGRFGYEVVIIFRGHYLGTGMHWLGLAGWYAPTPGKISPTLIVLRRNAA